MGLASDYNIYRDHAAMSCVIHTGGNVLHGAGSLEMKYVSAGGNVAAIRKNSPRNFVSGRVRFLLSRSLFGSQLTGPRPGFLFNLSAEDVTGSSGTGYLFTLERTGGNNTYTPTFFRLTAGMNTMTSLVTATAFVVGLAPTSVPLEATWKLDVENLGGMSLSCRRGVAANYGGSTLNWATILTINLITGYIDTGYLSASQGEGPALRDGGNQVKDAFYFDQMSVVPLLVGGQTT